VHAKLGTKFKELGSAVASAPVGTVFIVITLLDFCAIFRVGLLRDKLTLYTCGLCCGLSQCYRVVHEEIAVCCCSIATSKQHFLAFYTLDRPCSFRAQNFAFTSLWTLFFGLRALSPMAHLCRLSSVLGAHAVSQRVPRVM
jgi:hypothetical protein